MTNVYNKKILPCLIGKQRNILTVPSKRAYQTTKVVCKGPESKEQKEKNKKLLPPLRTIRKDRELTRNIACGSWQDNTGVGSNTIFLWVCCFNL